MKNSLSFYNWCYQNLPKNESDEIISRWDIELNQCSPKDISYGSHGFNRKGYWFKCLDHPEHHSELKNINSFTTGYLNNLDCNQCNSIGQWLINKYGKNAIGIYWGIKNTISPFEISYGSQKKVFIKCPNCGKEKLLNFNSFRKNGISCFRCSDGISYPEKVMYNLLKKLGADFIYQFNNTNKNWCSNYKYDFYIQSLNCIIETHGIQHYQKSFETCGGNSLQYEQQNDILKEKLAKQNNIKYYIVIDCRYSNIDYIKNNILKSELTELFDLSKIDWLEIDKQSQNSLVKQACDLWSNGIHNTREIGNLIKVDRNTVARYLKQGTKLNWCIYNAKIENIKAHNKKVYCIEFNIIYNSQTEANEKTKINNTCISNCCKGKQKTAGGYHWMYYDEYLKQQKENNS